MEEIVKFLGGSVILLGAVAWLVKSLIVHVLAKDFELNREIIRSKILRSSKLQEQRAEVLRELYANLVELIELTHSFVHPAEYAGEPTKEEKQKLVGDALIKYKNHFERNKIFLSSELCKKIQEFTDGFINPTAKFASYYRFSKINGEPGYSKEFHESWIAAHDKLEKEVPIAREAIEEEFREIIGVKNIEQARVNK